MTTTRQTRQGPGPSLDQAQDYLSIQLHGTTNKYLRRSVSLFQSDYGRFNHI